MIYTTPPTKKQLKKEVKALRREVDMFSNEVDDLRAENRKLTKGGLLIGRAMVATSTILLLKWVVLGTPRRFY